MIFELVKDFSDVLEAMSAEDPRRRMLSLLEEAIRRDIHFIDPHRTTLFQCMWNTCWWYDCPEAAKPRRRLAADRVIREYEAAAAAVEFCKCVHCATRRAT